MKIQTAPTTLTSLTIEDTGFNIRENRHKIRYYLTRTEMLTGKESREPALPNTFRTVVIQDTPETPIFDDEGEQIGTTPAGTAYSDWFATWNTHEEMLAASEAEAIEHGIVEWDQTVIDDITNDPNAAVVKPWAAGDLLAPPNRVEYFGVWYDIVQPHTASATFPPPIAALYSLSAEQPSDTPDGPNFTPWEAQTYALNAFTTRSDKYWKNRRDNNNQQGAPGTTGSGWMEVNAQGEPVGTWYNLGNEGYPEGYIATGETCYINNNPNNTFGPTVIGWSETPCPTP